MEVLIRWPTSERTALKQPGDCRRPQPTIFHKLWDERSSVWRSKSLEHLHVGEDSKYQGVKEFHILARIGSL